MTDKLSPVTIEKCNDPNYADTIAAIGAETFSESFGHLYKRQDLSAFIAEKHSPEVNRRLLADDEFAVWLAKDESGDVVGYTVAGPCRLPVPDMPPGSGEVVRFYLLKKAQGAGVGGRMLELALEWLNDRFEHMYLSVYAENDGALRLYQRHGFEKIHKYLYMVGNQADPEFIMKFDRQAREKT